MEKIEVKTEAQAKALINYLSDVIKEFNDKDYFSSKIEEECTTHESKCHIVLATIISILNNEWGNYEKTKEKKSN